MDVRMALVRGLFAFALPAWLAATSVFAQDPSEEPATPPVDGGSSTEDAAQNAPLDAGPAVEDAAQNTPPLAELEPPRPLKPAVIPYPQEAPAQDKPVMVQVKILVGADGVVQNVELLTPPQPIFDEAVVRAAKEFKFTPGMYAGVSVPVAITYTNVFQPPAPPPAPENAGAGEPLRSVLRGRLVEMGTRAPVTGATVDALVNGRHYSVDADERGHFRLPLPAGEARVTVHAPGCNAFLQQERLASGQEVLVSYIVERERYDPYEIIIVGEQRREEVSRIDLRGPEIHQVAGTFGDPYRVVQALPGMSSVMSLLPFPVVRGATPSSTGFLLDGTRVPLLYHLLAGPSVIHPEFIDEVQFYPGGAPVIYGGYTGGIVDGRTRRARPDEHLIDLDVNLLEAGGLIREPIKPLGISVTGAGRYGYPGLILSLATDQASLQYWDYQLRVDGGNPRTGWTVFAFGAGDNLETRQEAVAGQPKPPLKPTLVLEFHRLDLRGYHGSGPFDGFYRVVLGHDSTDSAGSNVGQYVVEPQLRWSWRLAEPVTLVWGIEGSFRDISQGTPSTLAEDSPNLGQFTGTLSKMYSGAGLVETLWRPTRRWLLRPGIRGDIYYDGTTRKQALDPRLTARYRLLTLDFSELTPDSDESAVWLKASVGIYHQPPRFVLPLPGMDMMPLKYGLLRSIQTSIGAETPLPYSFSVDAQIYFSYLAPTIFDLSTNALDVGITGNTSLFPTTTAPRQSDIAEVFDRLAQRQTGRAYGLELIIRRQSKTGVYGWLSYTLSRSDRDRTGQWTPYDYDRTHLLNLVAGFPLPRNWDLGLRFQYQSGRPTTTTYGYNTARIDGYMRIDVRVDKRAAFQGWLFDFYVDLLNVALLPEEVAPGEKLRYVLPSAGVRARF
jgi:TonB family protein